MTHRGYLRHDDDAESLAKFAPVNRTPSASVEHTGDCKRCGQRTTRSVTVGPPGHPRNGWECQACGEHFLRVEMQDTIPAWTEPSDPIDPRRV